MLLPELGSWAPPNIEMRHRQGFIGVTDQVEGKQSASRGELAWPPQTERRLCLGRESSAGVPTQVPRMLMRKRGKTRLILIGWKSFLPTGPRRQVIPKAHWCSLELGPLFSVLQFMGPVWGQIPAASWVCSVRKWFSNTSPQKAP